MRDNELYQRAALVWCTLHGTPAAMSLTKTMMAMDPLLDKEKAQKNKSQVSRFAKKVDLGKLFKMARSNNAGVPWRVATVWLAFIGTDVEKSLFVVWMMVNPGTTEEQAKKNIMKVSRLVKDLDFCKLWETAFSKNGALFDSGKEPSTWNVQSEDGNLASNSDSDETSNSDETSYNNKITTMNKTSDSSHSSNLNLASPQINHNELLFRRAAITWNSLRDTTCQVSLTDAIILFFPSMTKKEARKYNMKLQKLAKRAPGNIRSTPKIRSTGNVQSATSQSIKSTARSGTTRTWSTVSLTLSSDSRPGIVKTGPAVPYVLPALTEVLDSRKLAPVAAPPTLPIRQVVIPSSNESPSSIGLSSLLSGSSTSSNSVFSFSDVRSECNSSTTRPPMSSGQSWIGNSSRYAFDTSSTMSLGVPSSQISRVEANNLKKEGFKLSRKSVKQKQAKKHNQSLDQEKKLAWENIFTASFKAATIMYSKGKEDYRLGLRKKKLSARIVVNKIAEREDMILVSSLAIRRATQRGEVGVTPRKAGRQSAIPEHAFTAFCGVCMTYVQICQINGAKTSDRQTLIAKTNLAVQFKEGHNHRKGQELWDRILKRIAHKLEAIDKCNFVEARRVEWTNFLNFHTWFNGWKATLLLYGFARLPTDEPDPNRPDEPVEVQEGEVIFYKGQRARIINLDESRIDLDGSEGQVGGRPVTQYSDPTLPNAGTASSKSSDACTIICGSNADGEALPPHLQLTSKAKAENYKFNWSILEKMHTVRGRFGHSVEKKFSPTFGFNEKGGMDATEFSKYLLGLVSRLYPDRADEPGRRVIVKLDSGPGRHNDEMLALLRTEGIYIFMSTPNGTSVHQETDQESNYGTFKPCIRQNRTILFTYRQSKYHINQALEATTIVIEGSDDDADDGKNAIEIISDEEEDTEEAIRPDLRLVYPFAASRESIEGAAQGLSDTIVEAPFDINPGEATQGSSFVQIVDQDVERLNPKEWLNDNLVDFWMMWITRDANVENLETHVFTSHFFTKLAEDGPGAVENWTSKKGVDIFTKQVVVIPIVEDLHWSLCIILNPGHVRNAMKTEDLSAQDVLGCVLFFHSLKSHNKFRVRNNIVCWLNSEWDRLAKVKDPSEPMPFTSWTFPVFTPAVPYQTNGYDCGVFVCKYATSVLKLARDNVFTYATAQVKREEGGIMVEQDFPFTRIVTKSDAFSFDLKEIKLLRRDMKTLVERLSVVYPDWKTDNNGAASVIQRARRAFIQRTRDKSTSSEVKPKINETKSRRKKKVSKIKGPKVSFADLGLIMFGGKADDTEPTSPMLENPFEKAFKRESNLKSWKAVGAVPLTRNCLNSPLVRHEITTTNGEVDNSLDPMSERYAEIEGRHNQFIEVLNEAGYLGSVFATQIRRKARETLQEPLTETELTLTEPISQKKLAWLAEAKSAGQQFQKWGGIGHLNPNIAFLIHEGTTWQKEVAELERQKKVIGGIQKLL